MQPILLHTTRGILATPKLETAVAMHNAFVTTNDSSAALLRPLALSVWKQAHGFAQW